MTGKTLELKDILSEDQEARQIANTFMEYDMLRNTWKSDKEEIRKYVYATDTTATTNSQLPWKNKTTIPKLCQIRDNLYSNYAATLFPQRKNVIWEANELDAASVTKRDAIVNYMSWVMTQDSFKHEMDKIILDYIDYGNCFATVEWIDERVETPQGTKFGYIGPSVRRINPLHIVMNPTAESFIRSPKIVRSLVSMGELKDMLEKMSTDDNYEEYKAIYEYLRGIRTNALQFEGDWKEFENQYRMDGFTSFREYLKSGMVEILTFYGDMYNQETGEFFKNQVITVVDRHKLIGKKSNPSFFGYPPIFHSPWRKKPDNLWGMGPLDNLVGMQYRMDHIENMKADIFDLVTYPVQKIKGMVEEFTWQPGEKIFVSEEGDVELVSPEVNVLNANIEIQNFERLMEEMAGAPREAMGFRTPGEKTKYEVQRLENAASRVFQNKIKQFEEQIVEPLLNAMLELARRNLTGALVIQVFDDEFNAAAFQTLTVEDITGVGRIKPIAARHFAEQAELIQNLTNLTQSNLWPAVQLHFSGKKLAKIVEKIFGLDQYEVVIPFVGLAEQAEAQKFNTALQEQVQSHAMTATGMNGDYDMAPSPQSQGRFAATQQGGQ
jgi:hypothetical protein